MRTTLRPLSAAVLAAMCAIALPGWAQTQTYQAVLTGANESPPVGSQGIGVAIVTFDLATFMMRLQTTFTGLTGNVTAAHIHCCTATPFAGNVGVATQTPTFVGFPAGNIFGSYDNTFDMTLSSSYNAAFITANGGTTGTAFTALLNGIDAGRAYLNIHSSFAQGGEIRGFLTPVPEPASYALLAAGLAVIGGAMRRRRLS